MREQIEKTADEILEFVDNDNNIMDPDEVDNLVDELARDLYEIIRTNLGDKEDEVHDRTLREYTLSGDGMDNLTGPILDKLFEIIKFGR